MNLSEKLAAKYPQHTALGRQNSLINLDDTSYWTPERDGVTQGVLGTFALCPNKAHLKMRVGIQPAYSGGAGAMEFGDFFHRGLDSMYLLLRNGLSKEFMVDNLETLIHDVCELLYLENKQKLEDTIARPSAYTELEIMAGTARTLLQSYFRRWISDFYDFDWIDLEKTFKVPYYMQETDNNGVQRQFSIPVRGKYDGVFRDGNGKLWLFETKTKSYIDDKSIVDKLNYDLQVMLYMWSMKHMYGETPAGVIYNVVKRPQLRLKMKETLPEFFERIGDDILGKQDDYFIRYTASILPEDLTRWEENDFRSLMQRMYKWSQGEDNYRNSAACHMWNRPCEYMEVCAYNRTEMMKKREQMYPELDTPNQAVQIHVANIPEGI